MSSSNLWGFSSQAELDEWVTHCRRLLRRALRNIDRGVQEDDVDEALQELMRRFASGSIQNRDYFERQYGIAEALARYTLADFWRKKRRLQAITVDSDLVGLLGECGYDINRITTMPEREIIEGLLPHLTERQRQFLKYVLESGCDIEDVHGDRAKALERFGMTDGAYRIMMMRISEGATYHAAHGEVLVPSVDVARPKVIPVPVGPLADADFAEQLVLSLRRVAPGLGMFMHTTSVILEEVLFYQWRKRLQLD